MCSFDVVLDYSKTFTFSFYFLFYYYFHHHVNELLPVDFPPPAWPCAASTTARLADQPVAIS